MTDADLDRSYTALCQALGEVGQERSELLLSMVCLGLVARSPGAEDVIALIGRARDRCLQEPTEAPGPLAGPAPAGLAGDSPEAPPAGAESRN